MKNEKNNPIGDDLNPKVSNSGKSISEKYTELKIFQGLLYFTIFLLFLGAAFFLQEYNDMLSGLVPNLIFISFFIFQVFCVYCGVRIIDFLFDLNEHK